MDERPGRKPSNRAVAGDSGPIAYRARMFMKVLAEWRSTLMELEARTLLPGYQNGCVQLSTIFLFSL
jgi:hypothetical protein